MESENEIQPGNEAETVEAQPAVQEVVVQVQEVVPEAPQQNHNRYDPRRRMQELLSIPDRDRSDEEWDELNELEIQFAPGNRTGPDNNYHRPMNDKPNRPQRNTGHGGGQGYQGQGQGKSKFQQKPRNQNQNPNGPQQGQGHQGQQQQGQGGQPQNNNQQHKRRPPKPPRNRPGNNQNQGGGQPQGAAPQGAPAGDGPKSE